MSEDGKIPLESVREAIRFFDELGADFLVRTGSVPRAAGPTAGGTELSAADKREALEAVGVEVAACRKCPLAGLRTRTVPGEGNPSARLMFVGEAPGADEDVQGRPFVGKAGRLLDRIIAAMGFERGETFIANILKCRPPNNRDPRPEEVRACSPYLLRQVAILRPSVIVALGKPAANFFTGGEDAIGALRGRFFDFQGVQVMPTFHPAFLLRNERFKREVWEDMQKVMVFLGKR